MSQPHTVTILFCERILYITCYSRAHADQITRDHSDALSVLASPATAAEQELMHFAGVLPGGTLVDRLRLDDYFVKLEGVCR